MRVSQKSKLIAKAEAFQNLINQYAKTDSDILLFKSWIEPIFQEIYEKKIISPYYDCQLTSYFFNSDVSEIADRYWGHELQEAAAQFSSALRNI